MNKKILTIKLVCFYFVLFILSGCVRLNESSRITDTLIFTPRDEAGTKGEVVYKAPDCPYFIVNTILGYAILIWVGGNMPMRGNILIGNFEFYGMKEIYNSSKDLKLRVIVENFWLSQDRAIEIYYDKCH